MNQDYLLTKTTYTAFPPELKEVVATPQGNEEAQKHVIHQKFTESPSVLKTYRSWADAHPGLVHECSSLKEIDSVAKSISSNDWDILGLARIFSTALSWVGWGRPRGQDAPMNPFDWDMGLLECGLIDVEVFKEDIAAMGDDELLQYLGQKDKNGWTQFLRVYDFLQSSGTGVLEMEPDFLESQIGSTLLAPLLYREVYHLLPVNRNEYINNIRNRMSDDFQSIVLKCDKDQLLDVIEDAKSFEDKSFTSAIIYEMASILSSNNQAAASSLTDLADIIGRIYSNDQESLLELSLNMNNFDSQNRRGSMQPFTIMLGQHLDSERLFKLLSRAPITDPKNFQKAIPLIKMLTVERIVKLLTTPKNRLLDPMVEKVDRSILECVGNKLVRELLQQLNIMSLLHLVGLTHQNANRQTLFVEDGVRTWVNNNKLLVDWSSRLLYGRLLRSPFQRFELDWHKGFEWHLKSIGQFPPQFVIDVTNANGSTSFEFLGRNQDEQGRYLITYPLAKIDVMLAILNTIYRDGEGIDDLFHVFSQFDSSGKTQLHYPRVLTAAIPYLAAMSVEQIQLLLRLRDKNGAAPHQLADRMGLKKVVHRRLTSNEAVTTPMLFLAYQLGFKDMIHQRLESLTDEEIAVLLSTIPPAAEGLKTLIQFRDYRINPDHMAQGADLTEKVPLPVPYEEIELSMPINPSLEDAGAGFLKAVLLSAKKCGHLTQSTEARLRDMISKIVSNEVVLGLATDPDVRSRQYDKFMSYLTHVISAYQIGLPSEQPSDLKVAVLDTIADAATNCFPRWIKDIEKLYKLRPGAPPVNPEQAPTLQDLTFQRSRVERIHILELKIPNVYDNNIHEQNYRLNLFEEDLHTRLWIEDEFADQLGESYPKTKQQLRDEFNEIYDVEFLITSFSSHLNQLKAAAESGTQEEITGERVESFYDDIVLPLADVEAWFQSQCPRVWMRNEYANIRLNMPKDPDEIETYLEQYGILWDRGETVHQAKKRLDSDIQRLEMKMRSFEGVKRELREIAKLPSDERAVRIEEFTERNRGWLNNVRLNVPWLQSEVGKEKSRLGNELAKLKGIRDEVKGSLSDEQKILEKRQRMIKGETLDEVLTHDNIDKARRAEYVRRECCDQQGRFTQEAVVKYLVRMKVINPPVANLPQRSAAKK